VTPKDAIPKAIINKPNVKITFDISIALNSVGNIKTLPQWIAYF
jgi:hypothetical protein